MKRFLYALIFLLSGLLSLSAQQTGQQTCVIADTGDTLSVAPSAARSGPPSNTPLACASSNNLALPYNANNGQRGIMFDITAITNITINCFDVNMDVGTSNVEIYYKMGTHVGFTNTPAAWTLLGTASVTGLGTNIPTYVPINVNVAVTAGCTVAFYITRTTAGGPIVRYTNGTAVGFVFGSNANLQVKDGTGKDYPFGANFTPRRFNGTVYYTTNSSSSSSVSGPTSACTGTTQTYTFTGTGWTNYTWTVPAGSTILSGQGTNTITVLIGSTSGQICCTPSNACGPGAAVCVTLTIAAVPVLSSTVVNVSCNGGNNGSITINATPSGTYTYTWSPSVGSSATVTGLTAGSYVVTVSNSGGCSATQTTTVTQPSVLAATQSQVDLLCNGNNTGSATVNASGGVPNYSYAWSPSGGNASTASGLGAGTYTCVITDANGCTNTQSFTITTPTAISLATSSTPSLCGSPNGSASVVASGGAGNYSYSWAPSGGTAATEPNLLGGAYTVTVTDANNCTATAVVNVVGATTPTATITASTDVLCFGGNTGDATVSAAGGVGPYTYSWAPSGGTGSTESNLTAGTYTVTITDTDGCTSTDTVTITEPPLLTSSIVSSDVLCNGGSSGSATVTAAGGASSYTYAWSPSGGSSATASGLNAQTYTCTVTDGNGCTSVSTVTITEPAALSVTASQVDELCFGGNNGSATVNPSGGAGSYTYAWLPSGGSASTASAIYAGTYTCTVTDANGCTVTQTFTITEPSQMSLSQASVTDVDCFGNSTGAASVNASGGTGVYSYSWTPNVSSSNSISAVAAGAYQVTVTDANGCTATLNISITQPTQLTVTANSSMPVICNGAPSTLNANPGGGIPAYTVNWMPGNLSGNTQNLNPSSTTTYSVTVTDQNGCSASATTTITVNPVPVATFVSDIQSGCEPVCVNFTDQSTVASPGNITAWDWDFGDGNTASTQNPSHCYTVPGDYSVTLIVKTSDGCSDTLSLQNMISVFANPVAAFGASPQPTTILNPTVHFTDLSVNAASWNWSFGDVLNSSSALQNPDFTYSIPECYTVLLTVNSADGCVDTVSHPVCIDPDVSVYVPNSFTPNGDGRNEVFMPVCVGVDGGKYQLWIFDRWGNLIFTTTDINTGWDGHFGSNPEVCQVDTYVWKLSITDNKGSIHNLIGHVNLIR